MRRRSRANRQAASASPKPRRAGPLGSAPAARSPIYSFQNFSPQTPNFQRAVVEWFASNARVLPWRKTSDPYRIWISEIMLQQTQVATVIPYYERFLRRFPDIHSLAVASEEEVLKFWEGLGYYRRGKNLRLAAELVVKEFGGKFPETREELLKLPGIGPYSAGAILAIAFRKRAPALDGNLIRVYARFYGITESVDETKTLKRLWQLATDHSPKEPSMIREFAEGMMELGALICTPKNFKCERCPVADDCRARKRGMVENLPRKASGRLREKHFEVVSISTRGSKIALMPKGADPKYPDFLRLPFRSVSEAPESGGVKQRFKYSVTHRDFEVFVVTKPLRVRKLWIDHADLKKVLLPAIDRKILKEVVG